MLDKKSTETLEKQGYSVVGNHSVVKACGWTKNIMKGIGSCYKSHFYGINTHQCMQMSTSLSCANRCTFCWRDYKAPVSKTWDWEVDEPELIFEDSKKAHLKQLVGFKGNPKTPRELFDESTNIKHVALSLTGEPIAYPRINELVQKFHDDKISTFIVTNAQYPDAIKNLQPITQLYVSMDAPNKELLKKIGVPLFKDYWERFLLSLDYLAKRNDRTAIRITCIKGINMIEPENYAKLIERSDADFIEIKSYMFVGASQERLKFENMPKCDEIKNFGDEILEFLPNYEFIDHHAPSRVVLLGKKSYNKNTQISFDNFFNNYEKQKEDWKEIQFD